jgi:hypothetical protein
VFENRVLGRIYEPNTEEAREDWGKWHNEELHNKYQLHDNC